MLSLDSQHDYGADDQTIIIFDWDDTICPSSWLKGVTTNSGVSAQNKSKLKTLSKRAEELLSLAATLGKIVIVTNARRPWVEYSCETFLPSLSRVLQDVPVVYALEHIPSMDIAILSDLRVGNGTTILTESKAQAMFSVVIDFYSRYPNQSWKNLISIGDAHFEHDAIRQVALKRPLRENPRKPCRCKTIKLIEYLSATGMISQCAIIENLLSKIVCHDGDVDIDLSDHRTLLSEWWNRFGEGRWRGPRFAWS